MHKVIAIATATTTLKWHRFIMKKKEKKKQKQNIKQTNKNCDDSYNSGNLGGRH